MALSSLQLEAIRGLPEVVKGDNTAQQIVDALERAGRSLVDGDVIVVASKIIAKAEGRLVRLADVEPSTTASGLARRTDQDARLVELILAESAAISRAAPGLLVVRHRLGFVCANGGIDRANFDDVVILLPVDPDRSAGELRRRVRALSEKDVAVVISDTHGRPFRRGNLDVAIGVSGIASVDDRRGTTRSAGEPGPRTVTPVADQLAAAAGMVMGGPAAGTPAVLVRGFSSSAPPGSAADLIRDPDRDLYHSPVRGGRR